MRGRGVGRVEIRTTPAPFAMGVVPTGFALFHVPPPHRLVGKRAAGPLLFAVRAEPRLSALKQGRSLCPRIEMFRTSGIPT